MVHRGQSRWSDCERSGRRSGGWGWGHNGKRRPVCQSSTLTSRAAAIACIVVVVAARPEPSLWEAAHDQKLLQVVRQILLHVDGVAVEHELLQRLVQLQTPVVLSKHVRLPQAPVILR